MSSPTRWFLTLFVLSLPAGALADGTPGKEGPKQEWPSAPVGPASEVAKVTRPYPTAPAIALDVTEKVFEEAEDHTRLRVEFNGIRGDRVPAYFYVPKAKGKGHRAPAIMLQQGIGDNKSSSYVVAIGKQFASRGFAVLTIDAPGRGERRSKDKNPNAVPGLFGGDPIMRLCGDFSRAMDFLVSRPEVDKERLGFVGISWGAITGITYVAYEPRIKAMTSMVGGGNFLGAYTPQAAAKALKEGSKSSDPVFHVARIAPRPLLFVNVTKDPIIMRPWAEALHKAAPGSKVIWVETDHYFRGINHTELCDTIIDFMENALAVKSSRPRTDATKTMK